MNTSRSYDQTFQTTRQKYTLCIANYICLILDENCFHSNLLLVFKWKINMFIDIHFWGYTKNHSYIGCNSIPKNRCSLTLWDQSDSSWVTLTTPEKVHIWRHLTAQEETSKWLRRRHQSDSGGDTKVTRGETPKWLGRSCLSDSS